MEKQQVDAASLNGSRLEASENCATTARIQTTTTVALARGSEQVAVVQINKRTERRLRAFARTNTKGDLPALLARIIAFATEPDDIENGMSLLHVPPSVWREDENAKARKDPAIGAARSRGN